MRRPTIGVVMTHSPLRKNGDPARLLSHVNDEVMHALLNNGAMPLGIPAPHPGVNFTLRGQTTGALTPLLEMERRRLQEFLAMCDGLVFQGGARIETFMIHFAKMAYEQKVPTLGICSGQTAMARIFDDVATVEVDAEFHHRHFDKYVHTIEVKSGTRFHEIVGCSTIAVNSRHRYAVMRCPQLVTAAEYVENAEDTHIEVLEAEDRFYLSTRFHPESLYREDKQMNAIFQAFVAEAVRYRNAAGR